MVKGSIIRNDLKGVRREVLDAISEYIEAIEAYKRTLDYPLYLDVCQRREEAGIKLRELLNKYIPAVDEEGGYAMNIPEDWRIRYEKAGRVD